MGFFFSKPEKKQRNQEQPKVSVNDKDMAVAKVMVLRDRASNKIKQTYKDEDKLKRQAMELSQQGKKEEALFKVKQVKRLRESRAKLTNQVNFMERQIENIEAAMDDVAFTDALKDSNRALEKLQKEINLEEIEIAKELNAEGQIRKNELMELLQDDDEDDQDLMKEIDAIEARMLQEGFANHNEKPLPNVNVNKQQQQQTNKGRQAMLS